MKRVEYDEVEFDDDLALVDGIPFTGIIFSRYADGSPETELNYVEGLPDGQQRYWYPNGQIERNSIAVRGKGSSRMEYWYENGQQKLLRINDENNDPAFVSEWDEQGNLVREVKY